MTLTITERAQRRWNELLVEARYEGRKEPSPDDHCLIVGDLVDEVSNLEAEFIVRSHPDLLAEHDPGDTFCGVEETSWAVVLYNRLYAAIDEANPRCDENGFEIFPEYEEATP